MKKAKTPLSYYLSGLYRVLRLPYMLRGCLLSQQKKVPSRTQFILQQEEVLRCMAYFPIVIKTKHLQELRAHVAKLHSKPFDKVFQEVSNQSKLK